MCFFSLNYKEPKSLTNWMSTSMANTTIILQNRIGVIVPITNLLYGFCLTLGKVRKGVIMWLEGVQNLNSQEFGPLMLPSLPLPLHPFWWTLLSELPLEQWHTRVAYERRYNIGVRPLRLCHWLACSLMAGLRSLLKMESLLGGYAHLEQVKKGGIGSCKCGRGVGGLKQCG